MDEGNTVIDNSKAGELVENNSQWHPLFSFDSVPGNLSISAVPLTAQTVAQATAATIADPDFLDHDEGETEDEANEDMDFFTDDVDEAFEAFEALDEEDEAQLAAFALESSIPEPIPQAHAAETMSSLTEDEQPVFEQIELEQLLSNDDFISDTEETDLPDLEEAPSAPQTDQQMLEGNAYLHHSLDQIAADHLRSNTSRPPPPIPSSRERDPPVPIHHPASRPRHSPFQPPPDLPTRHPPLPLPHLPHHPILLFPLPTDPSPLPPSPPSKNAPRLQPPLPHGTPQHDLPDSRTRPRHHRQPGRSRGRLELDAVGRKEAGRV